MNLFKKNTHIIASFGEKELSKSASDLQKELESLLPMSPDKELRLSIAENTNLSMEALCAFSYFTMKVKSNGNRVVLKARAEVIADIKTLCLDSFFDDLIIGE